MAHPIIRDMREADAGEIVRMVAESAKLSAVVPRLTANALNAGRDLVDVVVAEMEGRLVGACLSVMTFSTWRGGRGLYVVDLFVDADQRGRNIGLKLLQAAASRGLGLGAGFIKLEVDHANAGADRFYQRLGFAKKDRERLFIHDDISAFIQQGTAS